jgi:hypothetical protein
MSSRSHRSLNISEVDKHRGRNRNRSVRPSRSRSPTEQREIRHKQLNQFRSPQDANATPKMPRQFQLRPEIPELSVLFPPIADYTLEWAPVDEQVTPLTIAPTEEDGEMEKYASRQSPAWAARSQVWQLMLAEWVTSEELVGNILNRNASMGALLRMIVECAVFVLEKAVFGGRNGMIPSSDASPYIKAMLAGALMLSIKVNSSFDFLPHNYGSKVSKYLSEITGVPRSTIVKWEMELFMATQGNVCNQYEKSRTSRDPSEEDAGQYGMIQSRFGKNVCKKSRRSVQYAKKSIKKLSKKTQQLRRSRRSKSIRTTRGCR